VTFFEKTEKKGNKERKSDETERKLREETERGN